MKHSGYNPRKKLTYFMDANRDNVCKDDSSKPPCILIKRNNFNISETMVDKLISKLLSYKRKRINTS